MPNTFLKVRWESFRIATLPAAACKGRVIGFVAWQAQV